MQSAALGSAAGFGRNCGHATSRPSCCHLRSIRALRAWSTNAGQRTFIEVLARLHAAGGTPEARETLDKLLKVAGNKAVVHVTCNVIFNSRG